MANLLNGLKTIEVDDVITCDDCGHKNHLVEILVQSHTHEKLAEETEVQFLNRYFDWNTDSEKIGEVECVCGNIIEWLSPTDTLDVDRI